MFKQQVKLAFLLSIRKMHSLLPSHRQLFLGNTICNVLYEFLMSLQCTCIYVDHINFFKSVGRSASKVCKPINVDQTGYFIASYGGIDSYNISRHYASPFECQLFHLFSASFWGKNVKINFGLTLTKFNLSYSRRMHFGCP